MPNSRNCNHLVAYWLVEWLLLKKADGVYQKWTIYLSNCQAYAWALMIPAVQDTPFGDSFLLACCDHMSFKLSISSSNFCNNISSIFNKSRLAQYFNGQHSKQPNVSTQNVMRSSSPPNHFQNLQLQIFFFKMDQQTDGLSSGDAQIQSK